MSTRRTLGSIVAVVVTVGALEPTTASAQCSAASPANNTTCGMGIYSHADKAFNPATGEDAEFFAAGASGARSTIAFLLDTSDSMRQLPIDTTSIAARAAANPAGGLGAADGCANPSVNALRYAVNRCIDSNGAYIGDPAGYAGYCDALKKRPAKWNMPFDPAYTLYPPADDQVPDLFDKSAFYHLDEGWAQDTTTVMTGLPNFKFANAWDACGAVSNPLNQAKCMMCTATKGYYIDPAAAGPVVLSGAFLNFSPPRYVAARKVVRDLIHQMDAAGNSRQAIFSFAAGSGSGSSYGDDTMRCFGPTKSYTGSGGPAVGYDPNGSGATGTGIDPNYDGARMLGDIFPPCGHIDNCTADHATNRPPAFFKVLGEGGTVNDTKWLFRGPVNSTLLPTDFPQVPFTQWTRGNDGLWKGVYSSTPGSPALSLPPAAPGWWPGTTPFGTSLDGKAVTCAPFGEALLGVGQFFSETARFDTLFPAPSFRKQGGGEYNLDEGSGSNASACDPGSGHAQCSCPQFAAVVIAGGGPQFDDNVPAKISAQTGVTSNFAKVAKYFSRGVNIEALKGLRPTLFPNGLAMRTFVVGFGTSDPALVEGAKAGFGQFIPASNTQSLRSALLKAVQSIQNGSVAFSASAVSAVQSRTGSGILVPRFIPTPTAIWEGHLNKYLLVSEDACGCTGGPSDPCDFNQDGQCGGIYLKDKTGADSAALNVGFIVETADGVFVKAKLNTTTHTFEPDTTCTGSACNAVPLWDAASQVVSQGPASRHIYTVVDSNGDGKFDSTDKVLEFSAANAATLAPYLYTFNNPICQQISGQLNQCMDFVACAAVIIRYVRGEDVFDENGNHNTSESRTTVLGDIFHSSPVVVDPPISQDGPLCSAGLHNQCIKSLYGTPTPPKNASTNPKPYEDYRALSLGAAGPTVPSSSIRSQDWDPLAVMHRPRIALVGANDGMLHAFHNGSWHTCDGLVDEPKRCDPAGGNCTSLCVKDPGGNASKDVGYYDRGTGDELWAFIPPDLLQRIPDLLDTPHGYFVDATPMVRDIWADTPTGVDHDFKKTASEFHTIAIIGERRGGTHFFALDVTDTRGPAILNDPAAGDPGAGFFRWLWPQFFTKEQVAAGKTYADFLPTPPPIGPVRVLSTAPSALTFPGGTVHYEERWIAALNGGMDTSLQTGRSVSFVDAWFGGNGTGYAAVAADSSKAYKFFGPSCRTTGSLTSAEIQGSGFTNSTNYPNIFQYPVAATVGMVGWGPNEVDPELKQNQYFFDTAVVGDVGGQAFTLRFNDPDPAKWSAGRLLVTSTSDLFADRQPFFQIVALSPTKKLGQLRAGLGSGDRYVLRDQNQGACTFTNLAGCLRRGCTVENEIGAVGLGVGGETTTTKTSPQLAACDLTVPFNLASACATFAAGATIEKEIELTGCTGRPPGDPGKIEVETSVTCSYGPVAPACGCPPQSGFSCAVTQQNGPVDMASSGWASWNSNLTASGVPRSGYYAPLVFGTTPVASPRPAFVDTVGAATYDTNRLKVCSNTEIGCTPAPATLPMKKADPYTPATAVATLSDPGWYFLYGEPTPGAGNHLTPTYNPPGVPVGYNTLNERTATPSTVVQGCAMWSTMTPKSNPAPCDTSNSNASSLYRLDLVSGTACGGPSLIAMPTVTETAAVVPPPAPQVSVFVSPTGAVSMSLVDLPRSGGSNAKGTQIYKDSDLIKMTHEIIVPRSMEPCRHAADSTAAGSACSPLK